MTKTLRAVLPWLIVAVLVVVCYFALCRRGSVVPPSVATVTDTLVTVVDGDTIVTVEYRTDPAASKELTKLRDELVGRANTLERLIVYVSDLEIENRYLADSLSRLVLDSVHGIVRVERGPAGIAVASYRDGLVEQWRLPVWRQRWTLLAGEVKPTVRQSRLPVDLGLVFGGGFVTPPDTWEPEPYMYAGLAVTRQAWTATVGPCWDGELKLRGEVRVDWRL